MKILLFQHHANDPLSWAIKQVTREPYVHAAILVDETKNEIIEAFFPHVRRRALEDSELSGIDVFEVAPGYLAWSPLLLKRRPLTPILATPAV
jgi:hypothetical protein